MSDIKEYSLVEVAINNGKGGQPIWIIIRDQVYDVTKFLSEHPGGENALLESGGKDATKVFDDVGHSADAANVLKKYRIGQLIEADRKSSSSNQSAKKAEDELGQSNGRSCLSIITCGVCS